MVASERKISSDPSDLKEEDGTMVKWNCIDKEGEACTLFERTDADGVAYRKYDTDELHSGNYRLVPKVGKGVYIDTNPTDTNTASPLSRGQSGAAVFVSVRVLVSI